jgi:ankyrin repeat protein
MISDEALCYFLPKLANKLLQERGYEDIYRRLININPAILNSEQKEVIDKIIFTLKELELQLEIEESKELNQAWENWEESLRNSEDINDMLLLAIAKGSIEEVKNLIEQGADIKKKDSKGNSPLDIAEYKGQVEIIKYLQQLSAKS